MKIESKNFNLMIGWEIIAVVTTGIVVNALSRRGQLNTLNIDIRNQRLSLNQ